jgi:hypothetical protein
MTKTQTPTQPATPITEWEPEALETLVRLRRLVLEAEAELEISKEQRRALENTDADSDTIREVTRENYRAYEKVAKMQSRMSNMYRYYRPN